MTVKSLLSRVYYNNPGDPPETIIEPPPPPGKVTWTEEQQKHINHLLASEKRKLREQNETQAKELEALKTKFTGTAAEKKSLEDRIEALNNEHLTKDEIAQKEYKRTSERLTTDLANKDEEAKKWRGQFEQYRVQSELSQAAADAKAYRASQIVGMFGHQTKVLPVFDKDGKEIPGQFEVKMSVNVDGKVLETTPKEAMVLLKGSKDYANLFEYEGSGGLGAGKSGSTGEVDLEKMANDPEYYRKNRDQIMALDKTKGN